MGLNKSKYIWHNGELLPWDEAQVHVLTHALHYGSSVFEGIRVYPTPRGSVIFRLGDHTRRMLESAKIHRIRVPWTAGPFFVLRTLDWMAVRSASFPISPPNASISLTRCPLPNPPIEGEQGI